jgi:hypothetical protein
MFAACVIYMYLYIKTIFPVNYIVGCDRKIEFARSRTVLLNKRFMDFLFTRMGRPVEVVKIIKRGEGRTWCRQCDVASYAEIMSGE